MHKLLCFLVFVVALAYINGGSALADCPPSSQVTSCSPKCLQDTECATMGGQCCHNLCNYKSCVIPKTSSKTNSKVGGSSGATGNYCGNMKCSPSEKCEMDKSTRRFKCVRA